MSSSTGSWSSPPASAGFAPSQINPSPTPPSHRPSSPSSSSSSVDRVPLARRRAAIPAPPPARNPPLAPRRPPRAVGDDPEDTLSTITGSELSALRTRYEIPESVRLFRPTPDDRVTSSRSRRVALYESSLKAGLRLPIHPFVLGVLDRYHLTPSQLVPNSIRTIYAFLILHCFQGLTAQVSLFRALYTIRRQSGWWLFHPRPGRALKLGFPTSIKGWKSRFFFADIEGARSSWGEPDESPNKNSTIVPRDGETFQMLMSAVIPRYSELLSEENLRLAHTPGGGMRLTREELKQATLRKRKAADEAEGSRYRAQHPPPACPPTRPPPRPSPPPVLDERGQEPRDAVDLTDDSPGERGETVGAGAAAEPATGPTEGAAPTADEGATPPVAGGEAPPAPEGVDETWPTGGSGTQEAEGAGCSRLSATASRRSLMNDGKRAERIVKQACPSEFQAELLAQSAGSFFRDAYVAHVWALNSLVAMRTVLSKTDTVLRTTRQELEDAATRAERAEAAAEASRAEATEATGKLDAATLAWAADLDAARNRETAAVERSSILTVELEMVNSAIKARDLQIESFVDVVKATEARAARAEAEAARMKAAMATTEAKAARAVEDYKSSEVFRLEVADAAVDAFTQGFEEGRDTVGRLFGLNNLEGIGPGNDMEEPRAAAEPPEAEAPTEGLPVEAPPTAAPATGDGAAGEGLADHQPTPAEALP